MNKKTADKPRSKSPAAPAGYSGTPLTKKLGIAAGMRVATLDAPDENAGWLAPLPDGVAFSKSFGKNTDIVHLFALQRHELASRLARLREQLRADAVVWVSWPKKASGVATDVTEDVIRAVALPLGFVDIKVCAVSAVWSGLKLAVRKALR